MLLTWIRCAAAAQAVFWRCGRLEFMVRAALTPAHEPPLAPRRPHPPQLRPRARRGDRRDLGDAGGGRRRRPPPLHDDLARRRRLLHHLAGVATKGTVYLTVPVHTPDG